MKIAIKMKLKFKRDLVRRADLVTVFFGALLSFALAMATGSSALARPTFGRSGLVVSASDLASKAGVEILQAGGNAADAAVATYFTLAVTRPYYASLGGGGLMLARFNKQITALDYRERAPHKSTEDMFVKGPRDASLYGGLAVGTPGNVKGIFELHKKFGKLPWTQDLSPAIAIAKNGFMVTEEFARLTRENLSHFNDAGKKFFTNGGAPLKVGDVLKQQQLAEALEIVARNGADGFYKLTIADDVALTMKHTGGIIDTTDLEKYHTRWMKPLQANVFGAEIYSMPPPSSGGAIMLGELKLSERIKLRDQKPWSTNEFHLMAEIMERIFFDRQYLADPDYAKVPAEEVFSDNRIEQWAKTIDLKKKKSFDVKKFELPAAQKVSLNFSDSHVNTTHYVVVDKEGNAVSATTTVNDDYGSGVVTERYGIVLNNEMDDFTTKPGEPNLFGLIQGNANAVAPWKTPLSSMTPTLVEKNGRLFMAVGAPGGPKIINAVYQAVYHALNTGFNLDEIVQMPRIHHQYKPDKVFFDRTLSPDTQAGLTTKGHTLSEAYIGRVYAIRVNEDGELEGAFDARGEGGAAGY